jgi:peptidoglycan/LPS O-acetylase OafA/YrhL
VGNRVIRFVIARVEEPTLALELGLFVGASVASVVAATAFWWAVERPTLELARRYVQLERAPEPGAPRA